MTTSDPAELEQELLASENATINEEWRVVLMDAPFHRTSNAYPERRLAESIQEARGGTLQRRVVARTPWEET